MNRNHLWKLLIIVFVVAWSAYEITPPQSRDLLVEFQDPEKTFKRDTNYSAIVEQAKKLQAANPKRNYRNLRRPSARTISRSISRSFRKRPPRRRIPTATF